MTMRTTISLGRVCDYLRVDLELVRDFADFGLYPTVSFEGDIGIEAQYLERLRKIISLHQALGINKEGIEVILNLREKITAFQDEVDSLRNEVERLKRHWGNEEPEALKRRGLLIEIDD